MDVLLVKKFAHTVQLLIKIKNSADLIERRLLEELLKLTKRFAKDVVAAYGEDAMQARFRFATPEELGVESVKPVPGGVQENVPENMPENVPAIEPEA